MGLGKILFVLTVLQVSVNGQKFSSSIEPAEEVVSIYGENFETPQSREPYFIKVHRCVTECDLWSIPSSKFEIEIVVPDINKKRKFYKYIVYNHTACKCGREQAKMHKKLTNNEVSETEFKAKVFNNPMNLRKCVSFCDKAQPRYKVNPKHNNSGVVPDEVFILYHQCFPGCKAVTTNTTMKTTFESSREEEIYVSNDISCAPYVTPQPQTGRLRAPSKSGSNTQPSLASVKSTKSGDASKSGSILEKDNGMLIYIASPKIFLVAIVLSVLLVSILIVDFALCRRQKGIIYSVLKCKKKSDDMCPTCADRQQKVIEIV